MAAAQIRITFLARVYLNAQQIPLPSRAQVNAGIKKLRASIRRVLTDLKDTDVWTISMINLEHIRARRTAGKPPAPLIMNCTFAALSQLDDALNKAPHRLDRSDGARLGEDLRRLFIAEGLPFSLAKKVLPST